tara:strand:- start:10580 stop:11467 length:888 start_codon:yes stop_codon:yes gene_type:complete
MNRVKKTKVGFIGLGIMGKPMVINLLKNDFEVFFYARKKQVINEILKVGGKFISTPSDIPKHTKICITNLPNTKDVENVVVGNRGLISNLREGSIVIDMSTISPQGAVKINNKLKKKKSYLIDAPVSGGEAGAKSGELSIMAGGDKKAYQKVKFILAILGNKITYIGRSGSGQICKACNQILVAQTIQSVSEIISIAKKSKINPSIIREALLAGYANSKILEIHGNRMIKSDYRPGFKLSLHHKDLKIARTLTKSLGLNLRGLSRIQKIMESAKKSKLYECDSSIIHTILEKTYK